jgi:transposase
MEFIVAHQSEQYSFTELCELFGICREAGYYCVRRFREDGIEGLRERSRAPKSCPHRVRQCLDLRSVLEMPLRARGV